MVSQDLVAGARLHCMDGELVLVTEMISCIRFTLGHDLIKPDSVLDSNIVEQNYKDYIYLDCIRFINQVIRCFWVEWGGVLLYFCLFQCVCL